MNIALFGYGKMGKEIEQIALSRGHKIVLKIDKGDSVTKEQLKQADVAIEFSTPHTVVENINTCFSANLPIVIGTTGWYDKFEEVKANCIKNKQALFYATNYSVGVNLFWKMTEQMAKLMNQYPDYDVSMQEVHHIHKLDKPSGTAITTAEKILGAQKNKSKWSIDSTYKQNELFIDVVRKDEVPGTHTVYYKSAIDEISLTHLAYNRKGFALGAVLAAEFLKGKQGIYSMSDML